MSLPRLFGVVILGLAFLVGGASSQDTKKDDKGEKDKKEEKKGDKKDEKKDEKKAKDTLAPFFKDLDLSADQKSKIAEIQKSFAPKVGELQKKIGELNKQIQGLKKDEQQGVFGVLTDDQKKAYDAAVAASKTKKKDDGKDKKKDDGKDKKKDDGKDKKADPDKK
jgi:hypothetical protein